jgi:hypothetical protein
VDSLIDVNASAHNVDIRDVVVVNKVGSASFLGSIAPGSPDVLTVNTINYGRIFPGTNPAVAQVTIGAGVSTGTYIASQLTVAPGQSSGGAGTYALNTSGQNVASEQMSYTVSGGGGIWIRNTSTLTGAVDRTENVRVTGGSVYVDTGAEGIAVFGSSQSVRNVTVDGVKLARGSVYHSTGFSFLSGVHNGSSLATLDNAKLENSILYDSSFTSSLAQMNSSFGASITNSTFEHIVGVANQPLASSSTAGFSGIFAKGGNNRIADSELDATGSANMIEYGFYGFDDVASGTILGGSASVLHGIDSAGSARYNLGITAAGIGINNTLTVEGNIVSSSGTDGILCESPGDYQFTGNTVMMTGTSGAVTGIRAGTTGSANACSADIRDNKISTNYASAVPIRVQSPVGAVRVTGNKAYGVGAVPSGTNVSSSLLWQLNDFYGSISPTDFDVEPGNASIVLPSRHQNQTVFYNPTLTANRTVTLPTSASFTSTNFGNLMTVTAVYSGVLSVGQELSSSTAPGFPPNTHISALGSGTGGTGTYYTDNPYTQSTGYVFTAPFPPNGTRVTIIRTDSTSYAVSDSGLLGTLSGAGTLKYIVANGGWMLTQ